MSTHGEPALVMHPIVLDWACQSRAHCCHDWRVDVPPAHILQMARDCAALGDEAHAAALERASRRRGPEGTCALPMRGDGSCTFLESSLCGYRLAHGVETMPVSCRKFPYLALLTPRRLLVGLSFACPTAVDLLATRGPGELLEDAPGPPPTSTYCDMAGDRPEDDDSPAAHFWAAHWSLARMFAGLSGTPEERLDALARRATEREPVASELPESLWSRPHLSPGEASPLIDALAAERSLEAATTISLLQMVCDDEAPRIAPTEIVADPPDDVILNRYLDHRLLVPEFLITGASHLRLLATLFAACARFRVQRARGVRALHTVIDLDRMILHSNWVPALFADGRDEMDVLTALWSMATAWPRQRRS